MASQSTTSAAKTCTWPYTLSQAFLPFECDDGDDLEFVNMVNYLIPISNERTDEIKAETRKDQSLQVYQKPFSNAGQKKRNLPLN